MKETEKMENYDIVVIGGGPAGITLAKMLGKKMSMAVIRPEDYSMIYCAMPYVIEGLIEYNQTLKKDSLVTDSGAKLIRDSVIKIDFENKVLSLKNISDISYDKLIIATGATPFIPPIPGKNLKGVSGFKTEKDLTRITGLISAGLKRVVVVGAGAIGIELSLALNSKGVEVDLVDMTASVLPNLVDKEMTDELEREIVRAGINLHLNTKVTELRGKTKVEGVVLDNGQIIHFDTMDNCSAEKQGSITSVVVFAAGMVPEISLVVGSAIKTGRDGIEVNEKMETTIPDVYAVGDCVQFASGITGKVVPGKLATNAVPMAKVLGFNLLGQDRTYPGFYNGAATKVGKFFVGGTGLLEEAAKNAGYECLCGYSEVTTQFPIMPEAKKMRIKLVADKNSHQLLGAQIISGEPVTGRIDLLTYAIQQRVTRGGIKFKGVRQ